MTTKVDEDSRWEAGLSRAFRLASWRPQFAHQAQALVMPYQATNRITDSKKAELVTSHGDIFCLCLQGFL